jgi:hypothetical protein
MNFSIGWLLRTPVPNRRGAASKPCSVLAVMTLGMGVFIGSVGSVIVSLFEAVYYFLGGLASGTKPQRRRPFW